MPGLGDPMQLEVTDFQRYASKLHIVGRIAQGNLTNRELIELESGV